jgi:hypothetical protein
MGPRVRGDDALRDTFFSFVVPANAGTHNHQWPYL